MIKKTFFSFLILGAMILSVIACGGSLRFVESDPDMKDFHPRTIGVLAVDTGPYEEARGAAEELIVGALIEKHWFSNVLTVATLKNRLRNERDLQQAVNDYLLKLKTVNYSDPALSKKIGDSFNIEAFLIVTVDSWNYAEEKNEKVAKAGLSMKLVEAETGRIAWRAGHDIIKEYTFIKPDLKDVARSVINSMISAMPH